MMIEALVSNPNTPQAQLYEGLKIPARTYYDWKKDETFMAGLREKIQEVWKDAEREVVDSMLKMAKKGNFQAAKYVLDNFGYQTPQQVEVDSKVIINVDVEEDGN